MPHTCIIWCIYVLFTAPLCMFLCSWPESAGFCQAESIGRSGDRLKVWVGQGGRRNGIRSGMIIDQSGGHRLKENREGGKGLMGRT